MAKILKVYDYKEPILRNKCREIERMEMWVFDLANDMWETMLTHKAKGLSANQVGYDYRMITIDSDQFKGPMINPVVVEQSEETYHYQEKCLSFYGYSASIGKRKRAIQVKFNDLEGKPQTVWLKDDAAAIVQHELDHLNGHLMIDHLDQRLLK